MVDPQSASLARKMLVRNSNKPQADRYVIPEDAGLFNPTSQSTRYNSQENDLAGTTPGFSCRFGWSIPQIDRLLPRCFLARAFETKEVGLILRSISMHELHFLSTISFCRASRCRSTPNPRTSKPSAHSFSFPPPRFALRPRAGFQALGQQLAPFGCWYSKPHLPSKIANFPRVNLSTFFPSPDVAARSVVLPL